MSAVLDTIDMMAVVVVLQVRCSVSQREVWLPVACLSDGIFESLFFIITVQYPSLLSSTKPKLVIVSFLSKSC